MTAATNLYNRQSQENITQNKLKEMAEKAPATPYLMPRTNKKQRQLYQESLTKLESNSKFQSNKSDSSSDDDYGEKFKRDLGLHEQRESNMHS